MYKIKKNLEAIFMSSKIPFKMTFELKVIPYPCKGQLHSTAASQRTSLKDTPKSLLQRMPIQTKQPIFSSLPKKILQIIVKSTANC